MVFNIKDNDYRLVVAVAYHFAALYSKFVGAYAQYDAIDAATVQNQPSRSTLTPFTRLAPRPIARQQVTGKVIDLRAAE